MPSMASITVKKNDGTTDVVFDAVAASGGDKSPAVWRQDTGQPAGLPVGLRPLVKMQTQSNGPGSARIMTVEAVFPYATQDSTTTVYSSKDQVVFKATLTLPQALPAASLNEAVSQVFNLMASTLFKDSGKSGFAPV